MYNFKIKNIVTNDGTSIVPKGINIIIGPNNSGKSQFLKDIKYILGSNNSFGKKSIVISNLTYELPDNKNDFIIRYGIESKIFRDSNNQYYIRNYSGINSNDIIINNSISNYLDTGNINIMPNWKDNLDRQILNFSERICNAEEILKEGNYPEGATIHTETYVEYESEKEIVRKNIAGGGGPVYSEIGESVEEFIRIYGNLFFNYLGTEEKLLLCKRQRKYGLQDNNTNFLSEVQFNSKLLKELAKYTKSMFKKDLYLDRFSWGDSILFRVGDDFNFIRNASRENSDVEIKLKDYGTLDSEGDGLKSFVTNYIALNMNDKNVLLLDEPESFLHPPLAKQLGEIIARSSNENKQIFISTHSVDLLKGILNVDKDVNIIRITRDNEINHFNLLEKDKIEKIISNPLLSSSNVLNGLFCEKVYICEAESDEEFYQVLHDKIDSYDSAFFTHGKNKQTLKDIALSYNDLGIPNFRIYDFDILKDDDFNRALNKFISDDVKNEYINIRKKVNDVLEKRFYTNGGIEKLETVELKETVINMLKELKKMNIIILQKGCLETCFEDLGIPFTENKVNWFKKSLELINQSSLESIKKSYIYNWIFKRN